MATEIKLRRGTKAQHDDGAGFTGAEGEVTVDTTDDTLRVHDGSLKGGHVIAKLSDVEASDTLAELSDTSITSTAAGHILIHDGSDSFDNKAVSGAITINASGVTTLGSGQALTNLGGGSGTTFLRKDGSFATPTNTTYSIQDGELSENNFTDDDLSKLNDIEPNADVTDTVNVVDALTAGDNITIEADGTITATDTNTTYSVQDGELSQNSFTNDDHTKLNEIEAFADVTDTTNVVAALTEGTNIDIAGNGTISATNTEYTGGTGLTLSGTTFNVDAAQTHITSVGTLSGLTTGATTVNGAFTVNNDFMEIISTTDSASEMPVLSLYRNGGAGTNGDELGAIRFFGNNSADPVEKKFFAGIYAETVKVDDGNERGVLIFHIADQSSGTDAVADVTADIVGDQDPAMRLYDYGLQLSSGKDLIFEDTVQDNAAVNWDTGSNNTRLMANYADAADIDCIMPSSSGTLSLDGVNQTSYRSGEIIETLRGYADGRTLTGQATTAGAARNIALEDVTAEQVLSSSYVKVNGTELDYFPPAGTKTVLIEYDIFLGYDGADIDPIFNHKIDIDGTVITQTQTTFRQEYRGHDYTTAEAIITVDGSGDLASGNINSWTAAKTIQVLGREWGSNNNVALHRVRIHDGTASATIINEPKIKITAIG